MSANPRTTRRLPLGQGFSNFPEVSVDVNEVREQTRTRAFKSLRGNCVAQGKVGEAPATFLTWIAFHPQFESFGGFVVLFNFLVMTMETHAAATADDAVLLFVANANRGLLIYYTAELTLRLYVMKRKFFEAGWNVMDFTIVVTGWISELLEVFQVSAGMDQIAMLKSLRMLRLLRLVRLFVAFRELYVLVAGIGRCMKTLFWASGLIFIVLNVWAILSVEFLDGQVKELATLGAYSTCDWCETAFSNIWYANLTWFQIISTADWTEIGRPLAEEFFWPYMFFVLNVFIVIWGLLNLIVAAIVDANISARQDDIAIAAKLAEQEYNQAWTGFESICRDMDADGSGDVSVKEFKQFVQDNAELKQYLTVMGIQEDDVNDLLRFMDEDGNGTLECDEFIVQFTAMRTLVEKTSLYFLLKFCGSIQEKLIQQSHAIQSLHADMSEGRSSCTRARTSGLHPDFSSVSQTCTHTSGRGSAVVSAALGTTAQTLRTTAQPEMPPVDMKTLPRGWYYFGASLPPEANAWCKAVDPTSELARSSNSQTTPLENDDPKEAPVTKDGQSWEQLPSNSVHVHCTKHICVRSPIGDVQLPQEIIESLRSVDRFIDSLYSELFTSSDDLTSEHIVDRFIDTMYSEPSVSLGDISSEPDPVDGVLNWMDDESSTLP